jgi:hypothetical protein
MIPRESNVERSLAGDDNGDDSDDIMIFFLQVAQATQGAGVTGSWLGAPALKFMLIILQLGSSSS